MSCAEEVRRCYGIDLDSATEDELATAHRHLDKLVPGKVPWLLRPPNEVEKTIEFVTHPTWRSYVVVCETGRRLVEAWAVAEPARCRRSQALRERPIPSDRID
jgi:hypothetical protein